MTDAVEPFVYEVDDSDDGNDKKDRDNENLPAESEEDVDNTSFTCMICSSTFEMEDPEEREAHLESCTRQFELKSIEMSQVMSGRTQLSQEVVQEAEFHLSQEGLRGRIFLCVVCGIDLSSKKIQQRCNHLKTCSKRNGISTRDVLQLIAPINDDCDDDQMGGEDEEGGDGGSKNEDKEEIKRSSNIGLVKSLTFVARSLPLHRGL